MTTTITCRLTGRPFQTTAFEEELRGAFDFGLPTVHPMMRMQRRALFRKDRMLHKRVCDKTGQTLISAFPAKTPFPVWHKDLWWSDEFDGRDYGLEYDPSRPFFEQYAELHSRVPRPHVQTTGCENSDYAHNSNSVKSCYMVFGSDYSENCLYGSYFERSRDCMDSFWIDYSELSYDCLLCNRLYNVQHAFKSDDCRDSMFLWDCQGLTDCFGCVSMSHVQHHIFNEPHTPEEYAAAVAAFRLDTRTGRQAFMQRWAEFKQQKQARRTFMVNAEGCQGNLLTDCEDCQDAYLVADMQRAHHAFLGGVEIRDVVDYTYGGLRVDHCIEACGVSLDSSRCVACAMCWSGSDLTYCDQCLQGCKDCFGCIGLKKQQYCILNKQYSKEEYEVLRAQIIESMKQDGSWGEFLPFALATYPFLEASASDLVPFPIADFMAMVDKDPWSVRLFEKYPEQRAYLAAENVPPSPNATPTPDVPDGIKEVSPAQNYILRCEETGRLFALQGPELALYIRMGIPLPTRHPDVRANDRLGLLRSLLWNV